MEPIYIHQLLPETRRYAVAPKTKKPKWIPWKVYYKLTDWLKDMDPRVKISMKRMVLDYHSQQKLLHAIEDHRNQIYLEYNREPDTLLIGRVDFHILAGQMITDYGFIFDWKHERAFGSYPRQVIGLRVVVVPYMKGWVLLNWEDLAGEKNGNM